MDDFTKGLGSAPTRSRASARTPAQRVSERPSVTPSLLRPKQTTKLCHEHHVYVIMHVIEGGDKFLVA